MFEKKNKGITLIALILTIVILLILLTIGVNTGTGLIKDSRYTKTISEMKTLQTGVNKIYEEIKLNEVDESKYEGNTSSLESSKKAKAQKSYNTAKNNNKTAKDIGNFEDYKYYTPEELKKEFNIDDVDSDYIINAKSRTVISVDGAKRDGNTYYSLNEIEGEQYNVDYINPFIKLSEDGGTYIIKNKNPIKIELEAELQEISKDKVKVEYAWSTSNEITPASWEELILDEENKATISKENITNEQTYYLWTKISIKSTNEEVAAKVSKEFIVKQSTQDDIQYAVIHKKMNLDGETYTTFETEQLFGLGSSQIKPRTKNYEGFTAPERQTITINPDGTTVVTYNYERNKYSYTLQETEGIDLSESTQNGDLYFEQPITLKAVPNTGYEFGEWQLSESGLLENSTENPTTVLMPAKNLNVAIAKTTSQFTIEYNLEGGVLAESNPTTYNVNTESFTLKNPTKEGLIFEGWTGSNGETPELTVTIEKGSTGNKTYTANWAQEYWGEFNGNTLIKKYDTLNDAFSNAESGNTIKAIGNNITENQVSNVPSRKSIFLRFK